MVVAGRNTNFKWGETRSELTESARVLAIPCRWDLEGFGSLVILHDRVKGRPEWISTYGSGGAERFLGAPLI